MRLCFTHSVICMSALPDCFTRFTSVIAHIALPERFTFPFCYQPHPLSEIAADELQQHLLTQTDWYHPFGLTETDPQAHGKMFGVLVVQHRSGTLGYLAAFSGQLAEQNRLPGFVPPVFDRFADASFSEWMAIRLRPLTNKCESKKLIRSLRNSLVPLSNLSYKPSMS